MKITTWNINGLRAALSKGVWSWIKQENPDVICLQEIKTRPDQITGESHNQFNTPHIFWNSAVRPGYSGVATLSQILPLSVDYGMGKDEFDQEGRVISNKISWLYIVQHLLPKRAERI